MNLLLVKTYIPNQMLARADHKDNPRESSSQDLINRKDETYLEFDKVLYRLLIGHIE